MIANLIAKVSAGAKASAIPVTAFIVGVATSPLVKSLLRWLVS